jgi:ADP-ribose pyrophosphatase YjhB (NUDIX family)
MAHAVRLRWWRIAGTRVTGCRVVAIDAADRVLLIRHSYGKAHWMLPGGGMKRGEDPISAAIRECREECGLHLADATEIGVVADMMHGSNNDVRVVAGWTQGEPVADRREIAEAAFFALHELPQDIAASLPGLLPDYVTTAKAARARQ